MLIFWSNIFFSLKSYIVFNYIFWLIEDKVIYNLVTLSLPILFPIFGVQAAFQALQNFVYTLASFDILIGPY